MLISLRETNKTKEVLLEQKKAELNSLQSELQTMNYEQTTMNTKVRFGFFLLVLENRLMFEFS